MARIWEKDLWCIGTTVDLTNLYPSVQQKENEVLDLTWWTWEWETLTIDDSDIWTFSWRFVNDTFIKNKQEPKMSKSKEEKIIYEVLEETIKHMATKKMINALSKDLVYAESFTGSIWEPLFKKCHNKTFNNIIKEPKMSKSKEIRFKNYMNECEEVELSDIFERAEELDEALEDEIELREDISHKLVMLNEGLEQAIKYMEIKDIKKYKRDLEEFLDDNE